MYLKTRKILSLVMNLWILVITIITVCQNYFYVNPDTGIMAGSACFRYFTVLSNILVACAALSVFVSELRGKHPYWVLLLKYLGTSAVTLTMMTVLCFLLPLTSFDEMLTGPNLYMHLLTPLASILSFALLDGEGIIRKRHVLAGALPMALYATVYMIEVVALQYWPDIYAFNAGGRWYISLPIMLLAGILLAAANAWLHKLAWEKASAEDHA